MMPWASAHHASCRMTHASLMAFHARIGQSCATDVVTVSPARKAPNVPRGTPEAQAALGHAPAGDEADELLLPPASCGGMQHSIGEWLRRRARCPRTLLAVFYLLKLRTWATILVRTFSELPGTWRHPG
jgi:hypothetical protein